MVVALGKNIFQKLLNLLVQAITAEKTQAKEESQVMSLEQRKDGNTNKNKKDHILGQDNMRLIIDIKSIRGIVLVRYILRGDQMAHQDLEHIIIKINSKINK